MDSPYTLNKVNVYAGKRTILSNDKNLLEYNTSLDFSLSTKFDY